MAKLKNNNNNKKIKIKHSEMSLRKCPKNKRNEFWYLDAAITLSKVDDITIFICKNL